jgi:hypothetical protein
MIVRIVASTQTLQVVDEILEEPPAVGGPDVAPRGGGSDRTVGCRVAEAAYRDAAREKTLFFLLIWGVTAAAAITVAYLLLQLTDLTSNVDKLKAAAAAGGVIISGTLAGFVVTQWNNAKKEHLAWADLVDKRCRKA